MGVRFLEKRKEWRLPGILYADDLILCGESEEDLKMMFGCLLRCIEEKV